MLAQVRHRLEEVRLFRFGWSNPFISPFRWDAHSRDAIQFAKAFTNTSEIVELPEALGTVELATAAPNDFLVILVPLGADEREGGGGQTEWDGG